MRTYRENPERVAKSTPEQYRVTQTDGTECSFANEQQIFGEPLFASFDKFDGRMGPSLTETARARAAVGVTELFFPPELAPLPPPRTSRLWRSRLLPIACSVFLVHAQAGCKHQSMTSL
jgi:hypothetical protein